MNDQQPGFSHEAAAVLNGGYFFDTDALQNRFPDEDEFVTETEKRFAELDKLAEVLPSAKSFDELPDDIKEIYRKVQRWDEGEAVWQERIGGETSFGMSVPASDLDGMNIPTEDGDLLAAAIFQAHEAGDTETAEKLALMADSPWQIQEAFGGSSPVVRKDDEQQSKNEPKMPSVPKSPFSNRKSLPYFYKANCEQGERSDLTGCIPASGEVGQKPSQGEERPKPPQSSGESPSSWPGVPEKVKEQILSRLPARYDREEVSRIASEIIEENLRQRKENPDAFFPTSNEDIARWAVGEAAERLRSTIRDREKEKYKALREAQLSKDVPPPKGFPGSKAQIKVVSKRDPEKIKAMLSATFGREMELQQVADLVGAPDDAIVSITPGRAKDSFTIRVKHPQYAAKRTIYKDEGKVIIHNDEFFMKEGQTGTGLGTEVLAKQIDNARSLGVAYLECHAGGPPTMNGYYTWPRFGYDQDLKGVFATGLIYDSDLRDKYEDIQRRFPAAETVGDIMLTDEGREWWKKNGVRMYNAKFDLSDNSRSLKIFSAYLDERKGRKEGKKSMPESDLLRGEIDDVGNGEEELPLSKQDEEALDRAWEEMGSGKPKMPSVPKSPFTPKS